MRKIILVFIIISIVVCVGAEFVYGKYVSQEIISIADIELKDNEPPKVYYEEEKLDSKVKIIVYSNEPVLPIDGWELSADQKSLTKIFDSNIKYELKVSDLEGNIASVVLDIKDATYIKLTYASHNSEVGWSYNFSNYNIAGKEAIDINPNYKTESLVFNIDGGVDKDFVQGQAYVYSHWVPPELGKCRYSGNIYTRGISEWKDMNSGDLVSMNKKQYFQFGGTGMNASGNTNTEGKNPIPYNSAISYKYGICGINFKLKSYEQYSIIYQIYVSAAGGWILPKSDGEQCIYSETKPFSAFRIALVPKSEKQKVLDEWSK